MSTTFEHLIHTDLETAVRRVSNTIQADCRVLDFIINEQGFSVSVAVGENLGQPEWRYAINGSLIHITAIEYDFWAELSVYYEAQHAKMFWAKAVQQMVETFFRHNPAYKHAISW